MFSFSTPIPRGPLGRGWLPNFHMEVGDVIWSPGTFESVLTTPIQHSAIQHKPRPFKGLEAPPPLRCSTVDYITEMVIPVTRPVPGAL